MAKWTRNEVAIFARTAGWGARADDASWVAMAESGGDDKVVNSIGCVGLMQINQPVHVGSHPQWTVKWLQDPINNMKAGLVLYKAAGNSFDAPWADSKHKGGIPEGWGPHVKGGGGTGGATPVEDPDARKKAEEACSLLKGTPGYEQCIKDNMGQGGPGSVTGPLDTAAEISRLAQAVAKAGNWIADPANWARVVYVVGGAVLAIAAVNLVARPYINPAYQAIKQVIPTRTVRDVKRQLAPNPKG